MKNTNNGRPVMVMENKRQPDRTWKLEIRARGIFHEFSVDAEEVDGGAMNFAVGIVEFSDGKVEAVPVGLIWFLDSPGIEMNFRTYCGEAGDLQELMILETGFCRHSRLYNRSIFKSFHGWLAQKLLIREHNKNCRRSE